MTQQNFMDVLLFLVGAVVISLIFKRLRLSPVLGYLLMGFAIGPHVFSLVHDPENLKLLGELGVVFLMFTLGLDLPWERLQELRRYVFGLGGLQVLVTASIFAGIASYFGASMETAVLVGSGLALSSTAVVMQLISERHELSTKYGRISFSVLLFQDFAVVILLVWVSLITTPHQSVFQVMAQACLKAFIVVIGFAILGRFFLRPTYRVVVGTGSPELFVAISLLVVLAAAMTTHLAGLSMQLGAFLGGLLLAETEYKHEVEADIRPFRALLLGLFFVTVGMTIDPNIFMKSPGFILMLFVALVLGKFVIMFLLSLLFNIKMKVSLRVSMLLAGGGEFVFVLFSQAEQAHLLTNQLTQLIYVAVVLSMMLTPFLAMLGNYIGKHFSKGMGIALRAAEEEASDLKRHVIIAGFGRVGKTVNTILSSQLIPHVVIDLNMARVAEGRNKNYPVFFGDARRVEVLQALGADRARAVVITVGEFNASTRMVIMLKRYFPKLDIFVRVRDNDQALKLREIGAYPVMPETFAPSIQLASAVLALYHVPSDKIDSAIEKFRQEYLSPQAFKAGSVPWDGESLRMDRMNNTP
jgi:CPA2 family monovalent cation:H+ antiporter-2